MPAVQDKVARARRQGAAPRRQPGRGRRHRRRDPGRRAARRGQGRPAARRHPALARHRDQGRRDDQADRAQHDDPDPQERGLLDRRGRPDVGRDPRAPGRARDGDATTRRSASSSSSASRRRRAACRRSRSRSTSTRTASSTCRRRTAARATSSRSRIEGGSGLSEDEIQQMVRDAETHADEDRRREDLVEAKNAAEQPIYATEKSLARARRASVDDGDARAASRRAIDGPARRARDGRRRTRSGEDRRP